MEFWLKKYGMATPKKEKLVKCNEIYIPKQEITKEMDENGYTYLGILELNKMKEHEIKNKVTSLYKS